MKALAILGLSIAGLGIFLSWFNPISPELTLTLISVGGLMSIWFKLGTLEAEDRRLRDALDQLATARRDESARAFEQLKRQEARIEALHQCVNDLLVRIVRLEDAISLSHKKARKS